MSVESELKRIEDLRAKGLVSQEEYEQRREGLIEYERRRQDLPDRGLTGQSIDPSPSRSGKPWRLVAAGVILGVGAVVALAAIFGASDQADHPANNVTMASQSTDGSADTASTMQNATPPPEASTCVSISDQKWDADMSAGTISGTATNNCSRTIKILTLTYDLYDASGAVIGNASDIVQNLAANDQWRFKASTLGVDGVAKFTLKSVEGYYY